MTVSPGERHNYLAVRLSRYRLQDPFVACDPHSPEKQWIGSQMPRLESREEDLFEIQIPGYDLRKIIQARDPLCCANAFFVQIRNILAPLTGVRMCPLCPHCSETGTPCQDASGSSAEAMGGFAGRADALFGAVESQKSNGSLHLHFFLYAQRLHQHHTLEEIARKLSEGLVTAEQFKRYWADICVEHYADLEAHQAEADNLEAEWPAYKETSSTSSSKTSEAWGENRLGKIPQFIWGDAGVHYGQLLDAQTTVARKSIAEELQQDGVTPP